MTRRALGIAAVLTLVGTLVAARSPSAPPEPAIQAGGDVTPNTVRLGGTTPFEQAITITQATYPATVDGGRPHAVILVRVDRQAEAMAAASRLTHFPTNAPVLYAAADRIPPETLAEIRRLDPDGSTYDANTQLYLVGDFSPGIARQLRDDLGLKVREFRANSAAELAEQLDRWSTTVHGTRPQPVAIIQLRELATGLPVVAWNAHMGHAIAFVDGETIPEATRRMLQQRWRGEAFMYLMGSERILSSAVQRELTRYGHVQRVGGEDAYAVSATFAGYRDAGRTSGFGPGTWPRDFGWGIAEAGHNFTFVRPDDWQAAVSGSVLSHLGKHSPMLLVRADGVPEPVRRYLDMVRPTLSMPSDQLLNHGWVLGGLNEVGRQTQRQLDAMLTPRSDLAARSR